MTDTKNKNESPALTSRYRASEERHRQFAREMEGELVISFMPNLTLPTPQGVSSMKTRGKFKRLPVLGKEKIEGIELMRALELGMKIGTFVIKGSDFAVDVKTDLFKAINVMPKDKIRKLY